MAGQASRMVRTGFTGFPAEGMQFFRSLARNNRREWFQPRKHIYDEQVKAPMMELVTALNAEMMRFAPNYVADEPAKAIYRLYRDTRFSKDKTPYKTHIAAIFPGGASWNTRVRVFISAFRRKRSRWPAASTCRDRTRCWPFARIWPSGMKSSRESWNLEAARTHGQSARRAARALPGFPSDHAAADLLRYKQWLFM
jgi:uncharacterized protein (TIGR02453 family)